MSTPHSNKYRRAGRSSSSQPELPPQLGRRRKKKVVSGHSKHEQEKWQGGQNGASKRDPFIWGRNIVIVLFVVGLFAAGITYLAKQKSVAPADDDAMWVSASSGVEAELAELKAIDWELFEENIRAFLNTTDLEERLKYVSQPEIARQHYAKYSADAQTAKLRTLFSGPIMGDNYILYSAQLENLQMVLIPVLLGDQLGLIDWDAYGRYNPYSIQDLLNGEVAEAEMRAYLSEGAFYAYQFRDDKAWVAYEYSEPKLDESVSVYVPRDSALARKIEFHQRKFTRGEANSSPLPFMFKLRSVNDSHKKKQFELVELINFGWVKELPAE